MIVIYFLICRLYSEKRLRSSYAYEGRRRRDVSVTVGKVSDAQTVRLFLDIDPKNSRSTYMVFYLFYFFVPIRLFNSLSVYSTFGGARF